MNIVDFKRNQVLKHIGLYKLSGNPNSERLTYINDTEAIRLSNIKANKFWYIGDGDELLNWYTNQMTYGYAKNPIYNRNKRELFWSRAVNEAVHRVHSGTPRAIIDTMSAVVGYPTNTSEDDIITKRLNDILEANNFEFILTQRARPMTLVEGDGAFKININPIICEKPLIEYYDASDWAPIYKSNILIGMIFQSYYKDKDDKDYILFETRSLRPEGLAVEFELYKLDKVNNLFPCKLDKIPELSGLQNQLFRGLKCLLAIPNKYYFDPLNPNRGKSVFDGKIDLFDFMDEILTQANQTNRVSTPVEYYPVDLLSRTKQGQPVLPKVYNRQFIQIEATMDGDGNTNSQIQTTQPQLNFDQYDNLYKATLCDVLIGYMSPATLGLDIARKDNAEAQREKEKQTIFTRNLICKNETKTFKELFRQLLIAEDYILTGIADNKDYDISIKYDEFANPSTESEIQILGPAWLAGEISTERYVNLLWGGKLSDAEMAEEIAWLDNNRAKDDFNMDSLMEHENEINNRTNLQEEGQEEDSVNGTKE